MQRKKVLHLAPSFARLTNAQPGLESVLQARWLEAQKCQQAAAYLAAIVMMGSVLEGLLLRALASPGDAYRASAAPKRKDGSHLPIQEWSLHSLIEVAADTGWLKTDRHAFSHTLRDSRNTVHPWHHANSRADFDKATCEMCWPVLNAAVDDLLASLPRK